MDSNDPNRNNNTNETTNNKIKKSANNTKHGKKNTNVDKNSQNKLNNANKNESNNNLKQKLDVNLNIQNSQKNKKITQLHHGTGNLPLEIKHVAFDLHTHIPEPPERHVSKSIVTVLSGGFAGMIAKTCTAPLERIQILNQTGATQTTMKRTFDTIFINEGIRGFWRGNFANCVRVFPHKSILFTTNDILRANLSNIMHSNSTYINFITGAAAGGIATAATYPIDLIRAHLAGTFDKDSKSMVNICKKVIQNDGVRGLFRGLGVTLAGAVPYEACRIGVYNVLRPHVPTVPTNYGNEPHPAGKFFIGACAGAVAGVVTYPTDTVRRMLQVQNAHGMPAYSNVWECISVNLRKKGIKRFYRGISAKLVRVVPDAAILFVAYEQLKNYFEDVHYDFNAASKK